MDIRSFFSPKGQKRSVDDDDDFVKVTKKKSKKRKDSDEEPIPKSVRKQLASPNVILDSDDESKKTKTKIKGRKKEVKPEPNLKETTPSQFFGAFQSNASSTKTDKRKVTEKNPGSDLKPVKQNGKKEIMAMDDDYIESSPEKTERKPNSKSLSTKLAEAASNKSSKVKVKGKANGSSEKCLKATSDLVQKDDKTETKKKQRREKSVTPQKETKSTKTPSKIKSTDAEKSHSTSSETTASDKQARYLKYQQWQNRAGPSAPGSKEVPQGQDFCMEGMIFVITGIQESLTRDEIKSLVERYGGKVTTSVSSRTTYLITGSDPGESKLKKADQHHTKIINEDEFLELIRTLPGKKSKYDVDNSPAKKSKSSINTKLTDSRKGTPEKQDQPEKSASDSPQLSKLEDTSSTSSLMWVDKYKPTAIKQIIGQQGANSNVNKLLNWLKNWYSNHRSSDGKAKPKPKFSPWGGGDPTGASSKAALLSGPPGVGKTTSATLVCKELGLPYVELNASDQRSKKILKEEVFASVQNTSLSNLFGSKKSDVSHIGSEHVLIMDEVDGMAGNEDRGGLQELIQIIKATKIPIICMCNDRSSPKMRSLVNYCFDLRFQRPRVEQITSSVMSICYKEGLKVQSPAVQAIIRGCNQDVRQVLHNLNMLKASNSSLSYDDAKSHSDRTQKDVNLGIFEIARKLLSESSSLSLFEKSDLFFMDYSMVPKFIQENYLHVTPFAAKGNLTKHLQLLSKASDSIATGDLIESTMRNDQSWSILPTLGLLSTVLPCDYLRGSMQGMINFPAFFGKLSTTGKSHRLLQELKFHSSLGTGGCTEETLNLDVIPYLRWHLTQPLLQQSKTGEVEVPKVTQLLDDYDLTREDFDSLMEIGQYQGRDNYMSKVDSKVKAAFTRTYNKESHLTPYAVESVAAKKKRKATQIDVDFEDGESESTQSQDPESDADDLDVDGMIKQSKKAQSTKSRAKKSATKGASTSGTSKKRKK